MKSIDIVCPVFREEASIEAFHRELVAATKNLAATYALRFLYVIDPSSDRSEEILAGIASADARVVVIVMSRRFGHQAALIAGLDASSGDAVVMLDSDMQHPPSLIPELVSHWESGAEIVQAVRKDGASFGLPNRIASRMFYRLFERFTQKEISTGAADFRLLSRQVANVFRDQLREHNPFFRGLITWIGYRIVFVPFTPAKRFAGRSNYSFSGLSAFALNGLFSFSKLPLRVCVIVGFAIAIASIVGGVGQIVVYLYGNEIQVPGWASLFTISTFATGMNLFFLGVLGEYIGLIFDEVKNRPRYLVSRVHSSAIESERPSTPTDRR